MKATLIGTAQWGQNYGRTNQTGRIPDDALVKLQELMELSNLTQLDTAKAYGDAETRIGMSKHKFNVQTKIAAKDRERDQMASDVADSLSRLNVSHLEALLIHDWHLLSPQERRQVSYFLDEVLDDRQAERVGISVYDKRDVESGLDCLNHLDLVQCPVNLVDQRLLEDDAQSLLQHVPVVQARSIFLQGWLANREASLSARNPALTKCVEAADSLGIQLGQLSMSYIQEQSWIDEVIVAPTRASELEQICLFIKTARCGESPSVDWSEFASSDLELIDPRLWR